MTLATDMGGTPESGGLVRFNPATVSTPSWPGFTAITPGPFVLPKSDQFTLTGTFTVRDAVDRMVWDVPAAANTLVVAMQPIPPVPYTVDCAFFMNGAPGTTSPQLSGICFSDGTKYLQSSAGLVQQAYRLARHSFATRTTAYSNVNEVGTTINFPMFLRVTNDGTNRVHWYSINGKDWAQWGTEVTNNFLTATQVGLCSYFVGNSGSGNSQTTFIHYLVSPGILGNSP